MQTYFLHDSPEWLRRVHLIVGQGDMAFAITRFSDHPCAYLNLNRDRWFAALDKAEGIRDMFDISFEGIGSSLLTVPTEVLRSVPVTQQNFWVGIDYYAEKHQWVKTPDEGFLLIRLTEIFDEVLFYSDWSREAGE